jgi:hypothetical protein
MNPLLIAGWLATQSLLTTNHPVASRTLETFSFEFRLGATNGVVVRRDGAWEPGSATFKRESYAVNASEVRVAADSLTGNLRLGDVTGRLEAKLLPVEPDRSKPAVTEMRFWTIQPKTAAIIAGVTGELAGQPLEGRLVSTGGPSRWSLGRWENGLRLDLDMGTERQNWNHARIAVQPFATPQDWRNFDGVRLAITTTEPRADAAVSFWVGEADGSWYYVKSAVPLTYPNAEVVLWFDDFAEAEWVAPGNHMDEDYTLDLAGIGGMGVGVVNPLGVGRVNFTVTAIELVKRTPVVRSPAQLTVTGKLLSVNGHDRVPAGIFGGYAGYLPQDVRPGCQRDLAVKFSAPPGPRTEEFYIQCFGDRYQTPTLLTDPNWHAGLAKAGSNIASRVLTNGFPMHFEFWNEPYLNWAERSRVALKSKYYVTTNITAGSPVTSLTGHVIPHFKWVDDGAGGLKVIDETAFSYWSGRGLGWVYDQMLGAIGPAIKAVNPDLPVIGGWGFRWNEDHWAGWDILYKPTIDRNIKWIDGIHEHHYQGDTLAMNGSYEVLVAYGVTAHNKWLYCYNTECNDLVDAPARGAVDTPEKAKAASKYRKMTYNLRDCLYSVAQSPDKLRARTVIHNDGGATNGWTQVGYGLMRDLRGQLVQTGSDDPSVWCVASVDAVTTALVVCVFNDHRQPRAIELQVAPPTNTSFTNATIEQAVADMTSFELRLDRQEIPATNRFAITLPARSAWKVAFPLQGRWPERAEILRSQFFAPDILQVVTNEFTTTVTTANTARRYARRAWVRAVIEDVAEGEATVALGNRQYPLPKALTADNINGIVEIPVPLDSLAGKTTLQFRARPGDGGYRLDMASIVIEHTPAGRGKKLAPLPIVDATPWNLWVLLAAVAGVGALAVAGRLRR